jgi:NDP-sugar pyrophosphorylase family protein
MALFRAPQPSAAGIVETAPDGLIVSFEEKPARPRGELASAGIYIARAGLFDELAPAPGRVVDFGFDVLPRLVGRMHGHLIDGFFADIGTPSALARAAAAWAGGARRTDA